MAACLVQVVQEKCSAGVRNGSGDSKVKSDELPRDDWTDTAHCRQPNDFISPDPPNEAIDCVQFLCRPRSQGMEGHATIIPFIVVIGSIRLPHKGMAFGCEPIGRCHHHPWQPLCLCAHVPLTSPPAPCGFSSPRPTLLALSFPSIASSGPPRLLDIPGGDWRRMDLQAQPIALG